MTMILVILIIITFIDTYILVKSIDTYITFFDTFVKQVTVIVKHLFFKKERTHTKLFKNVKCLFTI